MNIIKFPELRIHNELFGNINSLFEEVEATFARDSLANVRDIPIPALTKRGFPKMDVVSYKDKFIIEAAIPGLSKGDVNIQIKDDVLTITGNKQKDCHEANGGSYLIKQIKKSKFFRNIILPEIIDKKNIKAEHKDNGILRITLPILEEHVPKDPITIKIN